MLPKGEPPGAYDEIHLAARQRDVDRVRALLQSGVDPNVRNQREPNGDGGNTPLWFAAQGARPGGIHVATALLAAGAGIDECCEYGTTALHLAASWAHGDLVSFLVEKGADLQARDEKGATPLQSLRADRARVEEEVGRGAGPTGAEDWLARVPAVIELLAGLETPVANATESPTPAPARDGAELVGPATRRANRWLFLGLVVFALVLAGVVFFWMRRVVKANGGIVDPQRPTSRYFPNHEPAARADFVLPTVASCFN